MTEKEIVEFIRGQAKLYSPADLSKKSNLSAGAIAGFTAVIGQGATVKTIIALAEAMGYELVLCYKEGFTIKPDLKKPNCKVEPGSIRPSLIPPNKFKEAECMKCGLDAGVVEVAGHTQCANCGHIVEDCCGG